MTDVYQKMKELQIETFLMECSDIDPDEIDQEMQQLPGHLAYWNERYAQAINDQLMAKNALVVTSADVDVEIRDQYPPGKNPREADVKARCVQDERVQAAEKRVIQTEVEKQRMRGAVDTIGAKRDMLQSLGAKLRIAMQHDPVIREQIIARDHHMKD